MVLEPSAVYFRIVVASLLRDAGDVAAARHEAERALRWARTAADTRMAREFLEGLVDG
jgi:hypothetical protein